MVFVFSPDTFDISPANLNSLKSYFQQSIMNLGVFLDPNVKFIKDK